MTACRPRTYALFADVAEAFFLPPTHPNPSHAQMHFPPVTSVLDEVNTTESWRDLRSVLTAHVNVQVLLSGHFHKARVGGCVRVWWWGWCVWGCVGGVGGVLL